MRITFKKFDLFDWFIVSLLGLNFCMMTVRCCQLFNQYFNR